MYYVELSARERKHSCIFTVNTEVVYRIVISIYLTFVVLHLHDRFTFKLTKMETPIKCFAVESFGNSYKVFADQTVDSLYVQETLNIAKVSVFQFLYTEYLITDNWMYSMEWYLKKKGILRFELKKKFNEAKQSLRKIIELVESNSQDTYCNEYASQLDDMALPTLKKLRDQIAEKLQNLGVPRAGVCATMIVLQNLICMSVDTHKHIFKRIYEIRHIDIKKCFEKVYPETAIKQIDEMLALVMGDDRQKYQNNIINNKTIKQLFDKYAVTIYDQNNIKKASIAAYKAMPETERERYMLLEDGACILKDSYNGKKTENDRKAG